MRQNQFLNPYGSDYFYAIHGRMLDRAYVGQKTWDVLRVLDWLRYYGHEHVLPLHRLLVPLILPSG